MVKKIIFSENFMYSGLAHAILRIFFGIALLNHGQDKLLNFSAYAVDFPDPLGVGSSLSLALVVFSEFFCGLLLVFGLFTRLASAAVVVTFAIAFFIIHHADPFQEKELALFYLVVALYFLVTGAGRNSIDRKLFALSNESN